MPVLAEPVPAFFFLCKASSLMFNSTRLLRKFWCHCGFHEIKKEVKMGTRRR